MRNPNNRLVLAVVMSLAAFAGSAHAQEATAPADGDVRGMLRFGKLYSFGGGTDLQHGFGMDMRYELYPAHDLDGYVGLLMQTQYETGDAWRFVGGLSGGWGIFGLEVGVSHRTETATYAGSTGLHIGQSFTFGPLSVGGRLTIPLVDHITQNPPSSMNVQGIEGALTLRLSFGFTVHGERRGHSCHAGGHGDGVRDPHSRSPHH